MEFALNMQIVLKCNNTVLLKIQVVSTSLQQLLLLKGECGRSR